jgi:hypothetical protein
MPCSTNWRRLSVTVTCSSHFSSSLPSSRSSLARTRAMPSCSTLQPQRMQYVQHGEERPASVPAAWLEGNGAKALRKAVNR